MSGVVSHLVQPDDLTARDPIGRVNRFRERARQVEDHAPDEERGENDADQRCANDDPILQVGAGDHSGNGDFVLFLVVVSILVQIAIHLIDHQP